MKLLKFPDSIIVVAIEVMRDPDKPELELRPDSGVVSTTGF
jgi:hypothetical protein